MTVAFSFREKLLALTPPFPQAGGPMKKVLLGLVVLVLLFLGVGAWKCHEANKGFTPWMSSAELDKFLVQFDTNPPGGHPNYWDKGHWIDAVEARWHKGIPQYRIKYSAVPQGYNWEWYWYLNQDQKSFSHHVHEFADKGMVLLDPNSFLRPDDTRRYQGVWHLLKPKVKKLVVAASSAPVAQPVAPAVQPSVHSQTQGGQTWGPYKVIDDGIRLRFDQVDKQYLGRKCSVFLKRGVIGNGVSTGITPAGMFVMRGDIQVVNGELYGISRRSLDIVWFFEQDHEAGHGGPLAADQIDYVMVEKQ